VFAYILNWTKSSTSFGGTGHIFCYQSRSDLQLYCPCDLIHGHNTTQWLYIIERHICRARINC
jgi:hypothetical protein